MRRVLARVAVLTMVAMSMAAAPVAGATPIMVTADIDGVAIAVSQIPEHFCHDRAYPVIHCFATTRGLAAALKDLDGARAALAAAATDYVIVYSSTSYAGSYLYISQDYDTMATVGWNDRIRSYRGLNSALGRFWTDWFHSGTALDFCCNSNAPSLSATFDQTITSVYRR
ncbi:MAG: hypothetical protein ABIP03_10000 [Aquihabitans sp.]